MPLCKTLHALVYFQVLWVESFFVILAAAPFQIHRLRLCAGGLKRTVIGFGVVLFWGSCRVGFVIYGNCIIAWNSAAFLSHESLCILQGYDDERVQ